jgi:DNA primase
MYDIETNRITIPWYNSEGDLVGVIGRFNASKKYITENNIAKYFPLVSFPKSRLLYALNINYNSILKEKTVFVGEAEKFPMQLDTYGVELGVSLGSHSISDTQVKLVHSMFPNQIIVCFDEGIEEENIINTCKKLQYKTNFYPCKVGYIYDKNNKYMKKESKSSPTDLGKETFIKLLKECLIWI